MTEKPAACPWGHTDVEVVPIMDESDIAHHYGMGPLGYAGQCGECMAQGPMGQTPDEAVALWNRRPGLHLPEPGTPEWKEAVRRVIDAWLCQPAIGASWEDHMGAALIAAAGRTE